MGEFTGKVVIITGSSRGIGRAAAIAFGKEGASLTIHGQSKEKLEETAEALTQIGVGGERLVMVLGGIQEEQTAQEIVNATVAKFGRIDVLVNNAGVSKLDGVPPHSLASYDFVFAVNVRSVIQLTQLAAPYLEQSQGNVINVSSSLAFKTLPVQSYYSMSKAAIDHWTRNAANTFGEKGIRVNSINPGVTATDFRMRHGMTDNEAQVEKNVSNSTILKRLGKPEEMADVMTFLASSKASYITGTTIVVDGGLLVHGGGAYSAHT